MDEEVSRLLGDDNDTYGSADGPCINGGGADDHQDIRSIHFVRRGGLRHGINDAISRSVRSFQESMRTINASLREMGGTSTMLEEMFNVTKNLVGAGAFGIPSGFAALAGASRSGWAMLPAGLIITVMAFVFLYYFVLIGRLCNMLGASSYGDAWEKSAAKRGGTWKKVSFLVPLSVVSIIGVGMVTYSMMLADTSHALMTSLGFRFSRNTCLLLVTVFVLTPLCAVKKLSSLAPFSAVGTGAIVFTMLVMAVRCFDGSYDTERGEFISVSNLQYVDCY